MSKRLAEIIRINREAENETPYNFCDRWCERCLSEKQIRCTIYLNEVEQKITCIAHGRQHDDLEITTRLMEKQYEDADRILEDAQEEIDEPENHDFPNVDFDGAQIAEDILLSSKAEAYCEKVHGFLEKVFDQNNSEPHFLYHLETIAWHHTLLPVKLRRALAGFHAPDSANLRIYDAAAQLAVCEKAVVQSLAAFSSIEGFTENFRSETMEFTALLKEISNDLTKLWKRFDH